MRYATFVGWSGSFAGLCAHNLSAPLICGLTAYQIEPATLVDHLAANTEAPLDKVMHANVR